MGAIIKEYCKKTNKCVIRTNSYSHQLDHINMLITEAKKDFPNLSDPEIEIILFAGRHYARTMGITFKATGEVNANYSEISNMEYIY
jgi:hypothetical protein